MVGVVERGECVSVGIGLRDTIAVCAVGPQPGTECRLLDMDCCGCVVGQLCAEGEHGKALGTKLTVDGLHLALPEGATIEVGVVVERKEWPLQVVEEASGEVDVVAAIDAQLAKLAVVAEDAVVEAHLIGAHDVHGVVGAVMHRGAVDGDVVAGLDHKALGSAAEQVAVVDGHVVATIQFEYALVAVPILGVPHDDVL